MTPRDFCYWLRGSLELGKIETLDKDQVEMLKKHLDLVFVDVTSEASVSEQDEPKKEILTDEKRTPLSEEKIREIVDKVRERRYHDPFDRPTTWCTIDSSGLRYC